MAPPHSETPGRQTQTVGDSLPGRGHHGNCSPDRAPSHPMAFSGSVYPDRHLLALRRSPGDLCFNSRPTPSISGRRLPSSPRAPGSRTHHWPDNHKCLPRRFLHVRAGQAGFSDSGSHSLGSIARTGRNLPRSFQSPETGNSRSTGRSDHTSASDNPRRTRKQHGFSLTQQVPWRHPLLGGWETDSSRRVHGIPYSPCGRISAIRQWLSISTSPTPPIAMPHAGRLHLYFRRGLPYPGPGPLPCRNHSPGT